MDNQTNQNQPIIQGGNLKGFKKEERHEKIKRVSLGLFVIFFFAIVTRTLEFLAFSIICTAGISLVIYLPLSWLIGTFIITVYRFIFRKYINKFEKGEEEIKIDNSKKAIIDYILQARSVGFNDDRIKQELMTEGGWSKEEVEESFKITPLL